MGEQGRRLLWVGPCIGGPMGAPGTTMPGQSRYPKGFVYVDMPNNLVWFYEWKSDDPYGQSMRGKFYVRHERPEILDRMKLRALRNRFDWDVLTAEEEVSDVYSRATGTGQNR